MTVESRSVVVRLSAETAQYIREMQKAGTVGADSMSKVEKSSISASKAQEQIATGAGRIGIAAAVGLGGAVMTAANFDQAMSSVQAATHETAAGMDSLREAALKAGADTAFSATEAAGGIENLAKAGVSTQDILGGGLAGALDLAAAGGMEVADAAEAAAGALAQFKLDGDQATHVADLLAAGAGKAQGDVSDMVLALKQAGTVASQTGLSLEETVGALSAMAEQSLLGSDAGTSFKTMLAALTPNSEKAADAMAAYNIHAFDAQGNFVGMTELAGQLRAGLGDLTDEQRAMALETIFGSDAVRAASIIYDNGADGIANWTSQVNDAGYAAETAAIKQDNLRGDLEKLGGAFETALIGTGSGAQGPLRELTQGLTGAIDAYTKLPPAAQTATSGVLAGAAAVGGSIWVGSKLVQGLANTREAFDSLETSGSRAGRVIKGIGVASAVAVGVEALAGAVVGLANSLDESLPGVETLTGRLLNLQEMGSQGFSVSLGAEFDSIGDSIDRITAKTDDQKLDDGLASFFNSITPGDGRTKALREATAEIELLDEALAGLVASAGPDVAEQVLGGMVEEGFLTEAQLKRVRGELDQYDEAVAGAANQSKLEAAAAEDAADATSGFGDAAADAAAETESFKDMLDRLNGVLGGRAAVRDYQAAIDDFTASIKKNGNTFDVNSEKGRENQAMLDNIAGSALSVAENLDGAARKKFLTNAIDDIRTMGKQMNVPKSEIKALIELLTEANNHNVKPKVDADTGRAMGSLREVDTYLSQLDGKTATTYVNTVRSVTGPKGAAVFSQQADGSVLDFFADGGMRENHVAQIAPAGAWRIWAEPETGGEAYIPLGASKRERSIDIWEEVGSRLGVQFERFAGGSSGGGKNDKKPKPKFHGEQTEWTGGPGEAALEQAAMQAAEAAQTYYLGLERAQQEADERAEQEAEQQAQYAEAVLAGQERAWDQATDAAKAQVDASQAMVDSVKANMDQLGQAAVAGFNSPLFSKQQSGLSMGDSGGSGWRGALASDIAGLTDRSSIITQLSDPSLGLSPEALEELLGQADNSQIRDMLAAGEVDDYAAMFAERARLTGDVKTKAGVVGYGDEYAAASMQLVQSNQHLARIEAAIVAARTINILQTTTEAAAAAELARLLGNY